MKPEISRRKFLGAATLAGVTLPGALTRMLAAETAEPDPPGLAGIPVIDTHIHLYDPSRPQGVPWPPKTSQPLYQPSLPSRYRPIARPLGIVGAIAVECSSWLEDNQWVLDIADQDDLMVGTVGHLVPGTPEFRPNLDRLRKNPLFRGIRFGLGRQSGRELARPEFIADLQALADADLVLDTANPSVALLADVACLSERVPCLRIVIDHLPQMVSPGEPALRASYAASLKILRERSQVFVKVSEVLRRVDGRIPADLAYYQPRLDEILEVFGIDRVLYGSDWPNSDQWLPVPVAFKLVQDYFLALGRASAEKYFWRNSVKCYRWVRRNTRQPQL